MYDVNYFLGKYSAIPEGMWCIRTFSDGLKSCANGFCNKSELFEENCNKKEILFAEWNGEIIYPKKEAA